MDKYEYQLKLDQINKLIERNDYATALKVANGIDWHRVRSVSTLCKIADIYEKNQKYEESRELLSMAYERAPVGRMIAYRLSDVSIKLQDYDQAIEYYKEFVHSAPKDPGRLILKYKIFRGKGAALKDQIAILEEYRTQEYEEEWALELAYRYEEAGEIEKCVNECDELILWFNDGKYVLEAMQLKMKYQELTPAQQEKYEIRTKKTKLVDTEDPRETREREERRRKQRDEQIAEAGYAPSYYSEEAGEASYAQIDYSDGGNGTYPEGYYTEGADGAYQAGYIQGAYSQGDYVTEDVQKMVQNAEEEDFQAELPEIVVPEEILQEAREEAVEDRGLDLEEDGQLRMDIPEYKPLEKQITGQMTIQEILTEWEKARGGEESEAGQQKVPDEAVPKEQEEPEAKVQEDTQEEPKAKAQEDTQEEPKAKAQEDTQEESKAQPTEKPPVAETSAFPRPEISEEEQELADKAEDIEETAAEEETPLPEIILPEEALAADKEEGAPEDTADGRQEVSAAAHEERTVLGEPVQEDAVQEEREPAEAAQEEAPQGNARQEDALESAPAEETGKPSRPRHPKKKGGKKGMRPKRSDPGQEDDDAADDLEDKITASLSRDSLVLADAGDGRLDGKIHGTQIRRQEKSKARASQEPGGLTEEQKKLFTYFAPVHGMSDQLWTALENEKACIRGGTSNVGNIMITGEHGTGKTMLAVNLIKAIQKGRKEKGGRIAKVSADTLNEKGPNAVIGKLKGGALIVEQASSLEDDTARELEMAMRGQTGGLLIIFEDEKQPLRRFMKLHPGLSHMIASKIDLPVFNNDELVEFGRCYAKELDYSIDEMAVLALYNRIGNMQRDDYDVSVADVKKIIDEAIEKSEKKGIGRIFHVLANKRYDDDDCVILREKDFE